MIVTCHQPHFLPWIPYFNKLAHSDYFIVLDDVDYRKNYYQNRSIIHDSHDTNFWLTIPIKRAKQKTPINKIEISRTSKALRISINRLKQAYRLYLDNEFLQSVISILESPPLKLIDINMKLISLVINELEFKNINIVNISSIVEKKNRDERILTVLKEIGATKIIVGMGSMPNTHDMRLWENNGIEPIFQSPTTKSLGDSLNIKPGVSILHNILTDGIENTTKMTKYFWIP